MFTNEASQWIFQRCSPREGSFKTVDKMRAACIWREMDDVLSDRRDCFLRSHENSRKMMEMMKQEFRQLLDLRLPRGGLTRSVSILAGGTALAQRLPRL